MRIFNSTAAVVKNVATLVTIAFCYIYLIASWANIPGRIPQRYDFAGNITDWGSKGMLWIMPLIMLGLAVLLTVVGMFPSTWNTGVTVTEENRARVYGVLKGMLDTLKLTICLMFTAITITSARAVDMPWWSTFVMLGLIFVPIVVYMVLLFRAR